MAQLSEAIARYHKLLYEGTYRDLAWTQEFQDRIQQQHLVTYGRLGTLVLRPHFISVRELARVTRASEHLAAILDHIGDHVDLREFFVERLPVGIGSGRIEIAEAPAQGEKLRVGQALAAGPPIGRRNCFLRTGGNVADEADAE